MRTSFRPILTSILRVFFRSIKVYARPDNSRRRTSRPFQTCRTGKSTELDSPVAPIPVLGGHVDHQRWNVILHARASRATPLAAIIFLAMSLRCQARSVSRVTRVFSMEVRSERHRKAVRGANKRRTPKISRVCQPMRFYLSTVTPCSPVESRWMLSILNGEGDGRRGNTCSLFLNLC
jgi:hypothetical protein